MVNQEHYENLRAARVSAAEQAGNYFRMLSLAYNGHYDKTPSIRPLDLESVHGRKLMRRAIEQGPLKTNKKGFTLILCRYCNKTFIINDIDAHEQECRSHD